jgi:hypothetical protein
LNNITLRSAICARFRYHSNLLVLPENMQPEMTRILELDMVCVNWLLRVLYSGRGNLVNI